MVWSKYIFPSIRIVIWLVIALALVKIAFGSVAGTDLGEGEEEFPSSEFSGGSHMVERADLTSTLEIAATVALDPSVEVKAGATGTLGYWAVSEGETVYRGQALLDVHVPIMSKRSVDENGMVTEPYDTGYFNRHTVLAPITGKVTRLVELKEETTKTTPVFSISPESLSIEATLTPQEQYMMEKVPGTAKVTLGGGPEPFVCKGLALGTDQVSIPEKPDNPDQDSGFDELSGEEGPGSSTGVKLRCPAPEDIRLVAGLDGTMSILAGEVKDAVVVPVTAIQYVKDTGRVWIIDEASGEETERDVVLGLAQGQLIEVVKGLDAGETIRQYAPGNMEEIPSDGMMMGY